MKNLKRTVAQIAADLEKLQQKYDMLIYVGRFGPMHYGHQALMGGMIDAYPKDHAVLIGSCNEAPSIPNLFNYTDRSDFIHAVYPTARVVPMPDFEGDDESWFRALDHLIRLAGHTPEKTAFIGGSEQDVEWYFKMKREVHIVNRYGGTTVNVSASEVRDHLIHERHRKLDALVDPRVKAILIPRFAERWKRFRTLR